VGGDAWTSEAGGQTRRAMCKAKGGRQRPAPPDYRMSAASKLDRAPAPARTMPVSNASSLLRSASR
jgi:hypothetical protein